MATKPNIQPLGEYVLVEPAKAEAKTSSWIVLPDTSEEKPQEGTVIAVGDDKKIKVIFLSLFYSQVKLFFRQIFKIRGSLP